MLRTSLALCAFLLIGSKSEAGWINASSPLNVNWSETQPSMEAGSGTTKSESIPAKNFLEHQTPDKEGYLGNGPVTSSTNANSRSSSPDSVPAVLIKPIDTEPPIEARVFFTQTTLSCELFPSGVFRPPRLL
ncbi:MAG: hypothetical protein HUJ26_10400 [Planctomycetaceae bacterium]|nr:hypothetical protein [Planctomycetaceae bacterium]